MTPSKLHAVLGLVLLIGGFLFDQLVVTRGFTLAFKGDPSGYLDSWARQVYELARFYFVALGLLNIAIALLLGHFGGHGRTDWLVLVLMTAGSLLFVSGLIWEAVAGPFPRMEPACYVVGVGFIAVLVGLALELWVVLSSSRG